MSDEHNVLHRLERPDQSGFEFMFFCPGCGCGHGFKTDGPGPCWTFNGDMVRPTISPSLRVRGGRHGNDFTCHSFVRDGSIEFLSDCSHELAGKTVRLEPF